MIPIVLLHHNQPDVLLKSISFINERTRYPHKIFVVDNSSIIDDHLNSVLSCIEDEYGVNVIKNTKDNWIYGFNLALHSKDWPNSEFYAFSDADIYVPELNGDECWLEYMVRQLKEYCCIGKLGLSLSLENLEKNPALSRTLEIEKRFINNGPRIGENVVAPVDTTMALYRRDFFVTDFRFRIGHASLARPHYYTCRTKYATAAVHVGWDYYPGAGRLVPESEEQWKKAWVFAWMGAQVAPELRAQFRLFRRVILASIINSIRLVHGFKVTLYMAVYLIAHFPRRLNEIQARSR